MRKIIIPLITVLLTSVNLFAQEKDPILQKLLDASGEDMYLIDFPYELNPNSTTSFSAVLSKNTIYRLYFYQEVENEIIYKIDQDNDRNVQGGNINAQPGITYVDIILPKTAVYFIKISNLSRTKINRHLLLTFQNKTKETPERIEFVGVGLINNKKEEIITTTSQGTKESSIQDTQKDKDPEEVFFVVEEMPTFKGKDQDEFKKFLRENLKYPQEAIDKKIEGRVFVQFVIDKNGYIKDAKVMRGVHPSIDQEALRIV